MPKESTTATKSPGERCSIAIQLNRRGKTWKEGVRFKTSADYQPSTFIYRKAKLQLPSSFAHHLSTAPLREHMSRYPCHLVPIVWLVMTIVWHGSSLTRGTLVPCLKEPVSDQGCEWVPILSRRQSQFHFCSHFPDQDDYSYTGICCVTKLSSLDSSVSE